MVSITDWQLGYSHTIGSRRVLRLPESSVVLHNRVGDGDSVCPIQKGYGWVVDGRRVLCASCIERDDEKWKGVHMSLTHQRSNRTIAGFRSPRYHCWVLSSIAQVVNVPSAVAS